MPDLAPQIPLTIDRVERSRAADDQVRLRLTGRWLHSGDPSADETLLVVQLHGQRHRFPASREDRDETPAPAGVPFGASFTIPDWAVPERPGQAVLWVGDVVVPVPAPGTAPASARALAVPDISQVSEVAPVSAPPPATGMTGADAPASGAAPRDPTVESDPTAHAPGRMGPLAELLLRDTVSALHAELEQRAAEAARLRGALGDAQAELERRGRGQTALESAHGELRQELERLMSAVAEQQAEFDSRLTGAHAERDDGLAERDAAREELSRARAKADQERAADRAQAGQELAAVRAEAGQELAAVRAEIAEVRREADEQVAEARREVQRELGTSRAETEAMLGAARAESDARSSAAEIESRELGVRVSALAAAERRRAEEATMLREQLAAAHVARDAALGEAGGLRSELERLGSELATLREQGGDAGDDLSEARRLLADARAFTAQLRGESSP